LGRAARRPRRRAARPPRLLLCPFGYAGSSLPQPSAPPASSSPARRAARDSSTTATRAWGSAAALRSAPPPCSNACSNQPGTTGPIDQAQPEPRRPKWLNGPVWVRLVPVGRGSRTRLKIRVSAVRFRPRPPSWRRHLSLHPKLSPSRDWKRQKIAAEAPSARGQAAGLGARREWAAPSRKMRLVGARDSR
jgi:hypothetical protein